MATATEPRFTPEEYLARERAARERKSEYFDGRIYAMTGASLEHNQIVFNLARELGNQLRGGPYRGFVNDMRVKVPPTGMYTYPDVVVVCGEPRLEDEHFDTLLNPAVLIEVLSPSTERYDRGDKWAHYRQIESLQAYVLVAQNRARVEAFVLRDGEWVYSEMSGGDAVLQIDAVGVSVALAEVYEGVEPGAEAA